MHVLQASRDALSTARAELHALRAFLETHDQGIIDLLDDRLSLAARQDTQAVLAAAVQELTSEQAGLKRTIAVKLEAVAGSLEAVEWRTQESLTMLNDRVAHLEGGMARLEAGFSGLAESFQSRQEEQAEAFEARQQEVAEAILTAIEPVGNIMHLVQDRLTRAATDLGEAQGALFGLLAEREDRLEAQRDRMLAQLLGEFAGTIKARDRHRIGEALLEADEQRRQRRDSAAEARSVPAAPAAPPAPPAPAPAPPASAPAGLAAAQPPELSSPFSAPRQPAAARPSPPSRGRRAAPPGADLLPPAPRPGSPTVPTPFSPGLSPGPFSPAGPIEEGRKRRRGRPAV